jgi:hypothetical protein
VSSDDVERLTAENAELRRRVEAAEAAIATLRTEALQRRADVRALTEALPKAMSRRTVARALVRDAGSHPDKTGVATRAVRKLGRAPRKAVRIVLRRG